MNTIYTAQTYIRPIAVHSRRSMFWNKVADGILCAACTMGVIVAMFFLLTL